MINKNKYQCSQRELYAVCASGWESCSRNLEKFSSFRPLYTAAFVESKLKDISTVNDLPHRSRRRARKDLARTELKNKLQACHDAWKKLKLAVPTIWPEDQHAAHYKDMGQDFYADSVQLRWEACTGLMDSASIFVRDHAALLEVSPMLGPLFIEEFRALAGELRILLQKYVGKLKDESKHAEGKVQESNRLYKDLMLMFADARIIFRNDPGTLKEFFFESQLDLVSGQSGAGIKGTISNGQVPVEQIVGLLLTLLENGDEAFTADDGSYRFSQLAAGIYTMQVRANGYKEQLIPNITVNTGSFTTQHIALVPVGPSEEVEKPI